MAPKDLGWMAGVLDLKGRITLKKNKMRATRQAVLVVQSQEIAVIRRLGDLTGTTPELMASRPIKDFMRKNCKAHCPEAHIHIGDPDALMMPAGARWTITGAGLVVVLNSLLDYLSVDRGFAEIMNATMAETTVQGHGAGMVRAQLRRLRGLGWDLPTRYAQALEAEGELPVTTEEIAAMLKELELEQAGKSS